MLKKRDKAAQEGGGLTKKRSLTKKDLEYGPRAGSTDLQRKGVKG